MGHTSKKRLLMLITNPYAATNVIHSGLIKRLSYRYELYIMSDIICNKEITVINDHFHMHVDLLPLTFPTENIVIKLLRQIQKAIYFDYFKIETQKIRDLQRPWLKARFITTILYILSSLGLSKVTLQMIRKGIISLTKRIFSNNIHITFDGIISTSPLDIRENTIVNSLPGIRSLAIIISWDNLTSKGVINANHHSVLVWNQQMAQEYKQFYQIYNDTADVFINGSPRFDIYQEPLFGKYMPENFRRTLNIPAASKVILFTTSAHKHFPNQCDILRHLTDYAALHPSIIILLRFHPADDPLLYSLFSDLSCIRIWKPEKRFKYIPDLDSLLVLASMLRLCDVCIQVASTIRLEAAITNTPCISVAYDGNLNLPFSHSVKRFYSFSHQTAFNAYQQDYRVHSKWELFQTLDSLLDTPQRLRKIRNPQKCISQANQTTIQYIQKWLN